MVTLGLLLDRVTVDPAAGAALDSVTVQLEVPGALTVAGEQVKPPGWTSTVRAIVATWVIPFRDAVTVTLCALVTVPVVTLKVALFWVAPTVTLAGTVSDPLLLLKVTPLALAATLFKATVQMLEALLPRAEGEHDTEVSCAGALAVSVKNCDPPFREAVSNAV
jgi:hypothetical protein